MKNRIIWIIIIMVLIIGIVFAKVFLFYDKYKIPKGVEIVTFNQDIQVYDETKLENLIENANVDIVNKQMQVDTSIVGEQTCVLEYRYKMKRYLYEVKYTVVDTISPVFINAQTSRTFYVNEETEEALTKKITYADNYDTKPKLKVEGQVDFNHVGKYNIKYIITDQSGNEETKNATIQIKERPKKLSSNDETEKQEEKFISIEEQIANYKTKDTMIGIDISKWQGEVDFEKVKKSGVEFVILRMGVMKNKDTPIALDNTFKSNYQKAKSAGLKVGIYIYSESNTVQFSIENAEFIIENLNGDTLDFPVCFDWESWAYFNDLEMNLHRLNEMYEAFSNKLKEHGYDTMLYASENYLNNTWLTLKNYTIWVAKYSTKTPSVNNKEYILWQNTDKGRVDGIDGAVDFDIYYKKSR